MTTITTATKFIKISNETFPYSMSMIRGMYQDIAFDNVPDEELATTMGFEIIEPTEKPIGDVITEVQPILETNVWKQQWSVRAFNIEETAERLTRKKQQTNSDILKVRTKDIEIGPAYTFPDSSIGHIQIRDGDRVNLVGLRIYARDLITAEQLTAQLPFRTYENETKILTPSQMVDLSNFILQSYSALMATSWLFRDQVDNALVIEDIPTVPTTFY